MSNSRQELIERDCWSNFRYKTGLEECVSGTELTIPHKVADKIYDNYRGKIHCCQDRHYCNKGHRLTASHYKLLTITLVAFIIAQY